MPLLFFHRCKLCKNLCKNDKCVDRYDEITKANYSQQNAFLGWLFSHTVISVFQLIFLRRKD